MIEQSINRKSKQHSNSSYFIIIRKREFLEASTFIIILLYRINSLNNAINTRKFHLQTHY